MGGASGYLSVLVLALYINSEQVVALYRTPLLLWLICPLLLFWISRMWLLAHRGPIHDDPIVATVRDPVELRDRRAGRRSSCTWRSSGCRPGCELPIVGTLPRAAAHPACFRWSGAPSRRRWQRLPERVLPFACGRSYGDSCLNDGGTLLDVRGLDRFIALRRSAGLLRCEAGVTLAEILDLAVPRGWFLPVVPGTRWVSVGGAIANDIHGKNHHRAGTFGRT